MNDQRPFTRADYLALKAATRRAIESAGTLTELATYTRVDPAQLSRYGNPEHQSFAPLDVAMDLDRLAGAPIILRAWAERLGYELAPHESAAHEPEALAEHIPDIAGETADVVRALADTADQGASPAQARIIDREAGEAIEKLTALREDARRVIAGDKDKPR